MSRYDVVIIGAGVIGAATACEAARHGALVALIDQSALPNPRAASTDHSKVFRFAYPDQLYARMAGDALRLWRRLEEETNQRLMTETGLLMIGHDEPSIEIATYTILQSLGVAVEMLSGAQISRRFPQFDTDAFPYGVFDSKASILYAERILRALLDLARHRGVVVIEGERAFGVEQGWSGDLTVSTESGNKLQCEKALAASGPWTRRLLPMLADLLTTTRQEVVYFEPEPADAFKFDVASFPMFMDLDSGFYGFPVHHAGAMKIANHNKGEPVDPDRRDDAVSDDAIAGCRLFFEEFIPDLANARPAETRVCIYNNTPDDDFIVDWHPEVGNLLIATGFSGHGFKFGSLIGRICADLLLTGQTDFEIERFRLERFELGEC
jgi:monomeric sarcosine oxidase